MTELVATVALTLIGVAIVWGCNRPDPHVVKNTLERRQMRVREETSARWEGQ